MIIRNRTTKTLEAPPLNNQGYAVPSERADGNHDPDGVAATGADGAPLWGAFFAAGSVRGYSLRSHPWLLSVDAFSVLLVERSASFQKPIKTKKNQQKQGVLQNK